MTVDSICFLYLFLALMLSTTQVVSEDRSKDELSKLGYDSRIKSFLMLDDTDQKGQLPVYVNKNEARDNLMDVPVYIERRLSRSEYWDVDDLPTSGTMSSLYPRDPSKYITEKLKRSPDDNEDDIFYTDNHRQNEREYLKHGLARDDDTMKRGVESDDNFMKRGLARCIVNCLKGKRRGMMNFIQCKSMCH